MFAQKLKETLFNKKQPINGKAHHNDATYARYTSSTGVLLYVHNFSQLCGRLLCSQRSR